MPPWRDRLSSLKEGMFHANEWYFFPQSVGNSVEFALGKDHTGSYYFGGKVCVIHIFSQFQTKKMRGRQNHPFGEANTAGAKRR
jgi:hypothetical protein